MDTNELRDKLENEIKKTGEIISEYKEMSKPVSPDDAIGRISRMDAINNKSVTESALRQAESKLNALESVLAKMGSPDFGKCINCKEPIPIGRILIRPESLRCIKCAR